jgi:endonuclease/exonuclease/phosphatase family metal-dependent hydrolase
MFTTKRLKTVFSFIALFLVVAAPASANERDRELPVMTYNMYLGTDFAEVFGAQTFDEVVAEVAEAYGDVQAGDPAARIAAIADQIEAKQPTLVGLQEVALWRTGGFMDPAAATTVSYDFLQLLLDELGSRGLHYTAAVVQEGFDAELPAAGQNVFADVRYTDRQVILTRSDLQVSQLKVEGTQAAIFNNLLTLPLLIGNVTIQRGWTSIDVKMRGKTYRFINAHTEAFHPGVQFAQAMELIGGPADTEKTVILVGDLNSDAETGGASYLFMIGAGFTDAWEAVNPTDPGYTWPLFLTSPLIYTTPNERLDLVLTRGAITTQSAEVVGEDPVTDVTTSGLRPSDHAGVSALLVLEP